MRSPARLLVCASALWLGACCFSPRERVEERPSGPELLRQQREREREALRVAAQALVEQAARDRVCEGCDFSYATLDGMDLSGARLARAYFTDTHSHGVNLRGADLTETRLGGEFTDADFRGATLTGAYVTGGRFRRARFDGVDLRSIRGADGAMWAEAVLEGANLEDVSFRGPRGRLNRSTPGQPMGVGLGSADLTGANLRNARLVSASLGSCAMRGADLRGADLTEASASGADLQGADLRGAILERTRFLGTDLRGANLEGARIRGAEFQGRRRLPEGNALLTGATWIDGRTCEEGSEGRCVLLRR